MPEVAAWNEFRRRCLKPNADHVGSWTARRLARPAALRITWFFAPLGVTADQATLSAVVVAAAAMIGFGAGSPLGWLIGALLLELWYVLDHVDGQLARHRGTASLDGTSLDYLMHHGIHFLLPLSIGYGVARQTGTLPWCLAGATWSWGMLTLGLRHDARYKTFFQRLKQLHGTLHVAGGSGGRPVPAAWPAPRIRAWAGWSVLKMYEAHSLAHLLLIVACARYLFPADQLRLAQALLSLPALSAIPVAAYVTVRELRRGEAERLFAAWFRVPDGATLEFRDGRWYVDEAAAAESASREPADVAG